MTLDAQNHLQRWNDKSGKSSHATVDDGASQPQRIANALNGHSVVRFSGVSGLLGKPIRTAKGPLTVSGRVPSIARTA